MKIDPSLLHPVNRSPERLAEAPSPAQTDRAESSRRAADRAQVTLDREKLERLKVELARLPEVRQERVDALRRTLAQGHYRIDENRVAEAVWAELIAPARPGE